MIYRLRRAGEAVEWLARGTTRGFQLTLGQGLCLGADWTTPRSDVRSRSTLLGGRPAQEEVMKRALTRRVPFFVTMLTAALIVVGWGVASAGPCIADGQTCRTDQSCCSGVCVKDIKKSFGTCCSPTTCAAEGANCGLIADARGPALHCGSCPLPQTCGGGGTPNVCGLGPVCGGGPGSCGGTCPSGLTCSFVQDEVPFCGWGPEGGGGG